MMKKLSFLLGCSLAVGTAWMAPVLVSSVTGGALLLDAAVAEEKKTRRVPAMTERTYKALSEAQILIDPESVVVEEGEERPNVQADPARAISMLKDLQGRRGVNSYEMAQIWNTLAFAYYTLDDIPSTLMAYENVLKQEITEALELSTLRALFQLYYSREEYSKAISYMDKWEALRGSPDAGVTFIKASAYYQMDDFQSSLDQALKVEQIALAEGKEIEENWWYLQVILYNELKQIDNTINVLEKLITNYPKKQYWMHLAGMYSEKNQEDRSLSAYYAAYMQGFFEKESEMVMLSQRLLNAEVPIEAASILEEGFKKGIIEENEKNIKLLATCYTMAQEVDKAIDAWRDASKYSEDGSTLYRLAQALSNEDRHEEAVEAYNDALKSGVDDEADANFWLGISLMQLERWDSATTAFRNAAKDDDMEKSARRYLQYIASEKRRQQALREMLEA